MTSRRKNRLRAIVCALAGSCSGAAYGIATVPATEPGIRTVMATGGGLVGVIYGLLAYLLLF